MIEIGDMVLVLLSDGQRLKGTVVHMPQATGDCWIIRTMAADEVFYVQSFVYIHKVVKK